MNERLKEDLDFTPVALSCGSRIELSSPFGVDEVRDGGTLEHVDLEYPNAGVAGGRFIVSPSETLVLVAMFSGQSEERFELLDRSNGLKLHGGLPYVCGEAASYGFSPAECVIVMATANCCIQWWRPWEDGETEVGPTGMEQFGIGSLHFYEVQSGKVTTTELVTRVKPEWKPEPANYDPCLRPCFTSDTRLELTLPWAVSRWHFHRPTRSSLMYASLAVRLADRGFTMNE